jgi:hypothetical protein
MGGRNLDFFFSEAEKGRVNKCCKAMGVAINDAFLILRLKQLKY